MEKQKSWIEVFLMPLVIAGVGILGTHLVTQQQSENAQNKADSDRQVKILEIFAEKITSKDEKQRLLAIRLLRVLDDELAGKLASAVAETETDESKVKEVATKVADAAKARIELLPRIYIHVEGEPEKEEAQTVEELLEKKGWIVPGIERVGAKTPNYSQLRYFRTSEKLTAEEIYDSLKSSGYDISLNYISGYEESKGIRPMHFEIWFASGKPKLSP